MTAFAQVDVVHAVSGGPLEAAMIAIGATLALAALLGVLLLLVVFRSPRTKFTEPPWWPEFERDFARYVSGLRR